MIKDFLRLLDSSIGEAKGIVSLLSILFDAWLGKKEGENAAVKSE